MKVFVILAILGSAVATQLLSTDELEEYFKKFIRKELTYEENEALQKAFQILHRPERFRTNARVTETRMTLDCIICRSVIAALFDGVKKGQSDNLLIEAITTMCTSLGIESYHICRGVVELNLPVFNYIIRNEPKATPAGFCSLVLQDGLKGDVCPYNDPRFDWQVDLPNPVFIPLKRRPILSKPFKAVIVTDAHIDPYYEPFGVAECGEPTCCRKGQTPKQAEIRKLYPDDYIINQSIVNLNGSVYLDLEVSNSITETVKNELPIEPASPKRAVPAGYWGDYRDCDTPIWAYDDVIDTIATHKDIDVVYYIGDSIDHHVWETTYELINETNAHIVNKMRRSFGDHVLVVPAIGNHESQPTNQFAPASIKEKNLSTTWLYKALADKWGFYLDRAAKTTLLERGEFSRLIRPGLRVISLNNNVAYRYNWWLVYDPLSPKRHLDWLVKELHKAELAGEKVHILAHIPAGVNDLMFTWTREYNKIVNRFKSIIAAEFNGHTHTDEFKIFYSPDGKPVSMAWGGGSATTYTHYNLNYKIATFNTATFEPQNIVNYVYNLTEANLTPHRRPRWFQLYDVRNSFGVPDLSPGSMDRLVHRMVTNQKHLLDLYSAFYSKLSDNRMSWCDTECKLSNLCKTVITILWERQKCDELRRLYYS